MEVSDEDLERRAKSLLAELGPSLPALAEYSIELRIETATDWLAIVDIEVKSRVVILGLDRWSIARMTRSALRGLLIHELCHVEADLRFGRLHWLDRLMYSLLPFYKLRVERATDVAVIEKGFGSDLLSLHKFHNKHFDKYDYTDGLTAYEIKARLRKRCP